VILWSALVLTIALLLWNTKGTWYQAGGLSKLSLQSIAWLSILLFLTMFVQGYTSKLFFQLLHFRIPFIDCLGMEFTRAFFNHLPFSGGTVFNAAYLKTRKDFPISSYASYFTGSLVIMYMVFGIMGCSLLLLHFFRGGGIQGILLILMCVCVIAGLVFTLLPISRIFENYKLPAFIDRIIKGWELIKSNRLFLVKIILLQSLSMSIFTIRLLIIYQQLNIKTAIIPVFITALLVFLLQFSTLIPGNFGIRESIGGFVNNEFGFSFNLTFFVIIIDRLITTFWIFILGIFFTFYLTKKKRKNEAPL